MDEKLVKSQTCPSCGVEVPENCVRCRDCGSFLYRETKDYNDHVLLNANAREWYALFQNVKYGPFTTLELRDAVNAKPALKQAMVWKQGMTDWIHITNVLELCQPE